MKPAATTLQQSPHPNLLLGVTGTISNGTTDLLKTLGVEGPALRTLLTDLHFIAVTGLEKVWKLRHALIRELGYLKAVNMSKAKRKSYR